MYFIVFYVYISVKKISAMPCQWLYIIVHAVHSQTLECVT